MAYDAATPQIEKYFEEELEGLRQEAGRYADAHPDTARELRLFDGQSDDPQVNLLLQSFAYLSARLRFLMEAEKHEAPARMLEIAAPELARPRPCTAVAELEIAPDGANFANVNSLGRGRSIVSVDRGTGFESEASSSDGRTRSCRFTTVFDTPLWPISVSGVSKIDTQELDFIARHPEFSDVPFAVRVSLRNHGKDPLSSLTALTSLRFYIDSRDTTGYGLFEALRTDLKAIAFTSDDAKTARIVGPGNVSWLGFDDDQALFRGDRDEHPGCRLLLEYFACPEKFMFFEVGRTDFGQANDRIDLIFLFGNVPARVGNLHARHLRLNCVPVVNLYRQSIEPIRLPPGVLERRVSGSWASHSTCEIYQLEDLHVVAKDGSVRSLPPYLRSVAPGKAKADLRYSTRRTINEQQLRPGTEVHLSLVGDHAREESRETLVVGGTALCCDRRLPEKLDRGFTFHLVGPGPVESVRLVTPPSEHRVPISLERRPWTMVAQLTRNVVSLIRAAGAAEDFRDELLQFVHEGDSVAASQIAGLTGMQVFRSVRRIERDGVPGFAEGVTVELVFDVRKRDRFSAVLFASVIRHYLALYVAINTFVEVVLRQKRQDDPWMRWPPLLGSRAEL